MGFEGSRTIGIDLWAGQARGIAKNAPTCIGSVARLPVERPFKELFLSSYGQFAAQCREVDEPGVAIIAVHGATGRAAGLVRLRARPGRHVAAIIGRHDHADLFIDASDRLALRHLAVVLDPVASYKRGESTVSFRVLDLRTTEGFTDEDGRMLRGMRCEGPALLRCAGHAFFLLPLGDPSDWPDRAEDAWGCIPQRVYFDEVSAFAEGSLPRLQQQKRDPNCSTITRTHGPRDSAVNLDAHGNAAGIFEMFGPNVSGKLRIGHDELRDGVLLGRYERCTSAGFTDDASVSRVHALLIQVDDTVLLIDTASTNGTRIAGEDKTRVITVTSDLDLRIGKATHARWRFLS
jgi:pSer/pThr/pTyr-binding forkhead associated (FHA) protein